MSRGGDGGGIEGGGGESERESGASSICERNRDIALEKDRGRKEYVGM